MEPAATPPRLTQPRRKSGAAPTGLAEADREALELAAEHRLVLAAHVARLFGRSIPAAACRLRALRRRGLIDSSPLLHAQPLTWRIRPAGLRAIGSSLPPPRPPDAGSYRHDVGLAWLYVAARAGAFGLLEEIVSERRMRSHDGTSDGRRDPYAVRLGGLTADGEARLHYPDLVLVTASGHRAALELELSAKDVARRERILRGYAADGRIDAVVYLVERRSLGEAIARSAKRLGISELVWVQSVTVRAPGGPPPRVAGRVRAHAPGAQAGR